MRHVTAIWIHVVSFPPLHCRSLMPAGKQSSVRLGRRELSALKVGQVHMFYQALSSIYTFNQFQGTFLSCMQVARAFAVLVKVNLTSSLFLFIFIYIFFIHLFICFFCFRGQWQKVSTHLPLQGTFRSRLQSWTRNKRALTGLHLYWRSQRGRLCGKLRVGRVVEMISTFWGVQGH